MSDPPFPPAGLAADPSEPDLPVYAANSIQALLMMIPTIGSGLERMIFGPGQELRLRRFEATLREVAERLRDLGETNGVRKQEFIALLQKLTPSIVSSTAEEKRRAFRGLLVNAALTPERSIDWEEAQLAAELLERIEWPGIEILSRLHASREQTSDIAIVFDDPSSYLAHWPNNELAPRARFPLTFGHTVTEAWVDRLLQLKLINRTHPLRRPDNSANGTITPGFGDMQLTRLGMLLVKWALTEQKPSQDRPAR